MYTVHITKLLWSIVWIVSPRALDRRSHNNAVKIKIREGKNENILNKTEYDVGSLDVRRYSSTLFIDAWFLCIFRCFRYYRILCNVFLRQTVLRLVMWMRQYQIVFAWSIIHIVICNIGIQTHMLNLLKI